MVEEIKRLDSSFSRLSKRLNDFPDKGRRGNLSDLEGIVKDGSEVLKEIQQKSSEEARELLRLYGPVILALEEFLRLHNSADPKNPKETDAAYNETADLIGKLKKMREALGGNFDKKI